jgi:hypothetical protein
MSNLGTDVGMAVGGGAAFAGVLVAIGLASNGYFAGWDPEAVFALGAVAGAGVGLGIREYENHQKRKVQEWETRQRLEQMGLGHLLDKDRSPPSGPDH